MSAAGEAAVYTDARQRSWAPADRTRRVVGSSGDAPAPAHVRGGRAQSQVSVLDALTDIDLVVGS